MAYDFKTELKYGAVGELFVYEALVAAGFWDIQHTKLEGEPVTVEGRTVAETLELAKPYANQKDIEVAGHVIEVKRHTRRFTTPDTYPLPFIFPETVRSYEERTDKPFIYAAVCLETKSIIWLPADTKPKWSERRIYDTVRQYHVNTYQAPRELWLSQEEGISYLKKSIPAAYF